MICGVGKSTTSFTSNLCIEGNPLLPAIKTFFIDVVDRRMREEEGHCIKRIATKITFTHHYGTPWTKDYMDCEISIQLRALSYKPLCILGK